MPTTIDEVIRQRYATQHLTSAPMADAASVVRRLLCVQAQDAPLSRYSIGLRTGDATDDAVGAALDAGVLVRTHILRPTWHVVAAEDLRWVLALTSAKVESALAARHRQLGLDTALLDRAFATLGELLRDRHVLTAPEIGAAFGEVGLPTVGEQVRHLLLVAEIRGLVCSGPRRGGAHAYGLVDELVAPAPAPTLQRADARRQLVGRFFAGHGPASERDLLRWTTLTLTEIRAALADLRDDLATVTVDGTTLWFDRATVVDDDPDRRALLLPAFDEGYLSYATLDVPRAPGHPWGTEPYHFAESGGGVVVCDRRDVGWWKRKETGRSAMTVSLWLANSVDAEQRASVAAEAARLAAFFGRELRLVLADG